MNKIDFHSHILPRVDDGASSEQMTYEMLSSLKSQGVDTVVFTPHYYSTHEPIESFLERREKARLEEDASGKFPTWLYGAEVRFSEYLFNNSNLLPLCIEGTRTMLLELPFDRPVSDATVRLIERLVGEYDIVPVLAHIERYKSLVRSKRLMGDMLDLGCVLQVNLESFCSFGKRRLIKLVNEGYIGALGTDSHNLNDRPADYNSGYSILEKACSFETLNQIQSTMQHILNLKDR